MTPEEKLKNLSPSHDHFELVNDPWHADAFADCDPAIEDAIAHDRICTIEVDSVGIRRSVRRKIWYSVDWCGNLIQEWGSDTPPGH